MQQIVARFDRRAPRVDGALRQWSASREPGGSDGPRIQAVDRPVLANALALVHFDEDVDVADLGRLVAELGAVTVASIQEQVLAPLEPQGGRPLTTELVRRLAERAWGEAARTPGTLTHEDPDLRELCSESVLRLLMVGADADPAPPLRSTAEIVALGEHDVVVWRRLVAQALEDPWSGRAETLLAMLDPQLHPQETEAIQALARLCRRLVEEDERRAVADHIRRVIASTGLTQREFASLVGTSSSRMSTYVTGTVTPSAAMLLRINRTAKRSRSLTRRATGSNEPA